MPRDARGTENWQESANEVAAKKRKSKHLKIWQSVSLHIHIR